MAGILKLIGLLPVQGQTLSYDDGAGGGPVSVPIPDGYYYPIGSHGRLSAIALATTVLSVSAGHRFSVGDVIEIWDRSAGVVLYEDVTVIGGSATIVQVDTAITASAGDRLYDPTDLVGTLEARLSTVSDDIRVRIGETTGVPEFETLGAFTETVDLANAAALQAYLRLGSSVSLDAGTPVAGDACVYGSFCPAVPATDEEHLRTRTRQEHEADDGSIRIYNVASKRSIELKVRFSGAPRADLWTERHVFEDFVDHAGEGYRCRYYPDREVRAPYDRADEPWGWEEWLLKKPTTWDPRRVVRSRQDLWELALTLQRHVG